MLICSFPVLRPFAPFLSNSFLFALWESELKGFVWNNARQVVNIDPQSIKYHVHFLIPPLCRRTAGWQVRYARL